MSEPLLACCMCGRRVAILYGDYGICLACVPPKMRLMVWETPTCRSASSRGRA